MHLKLSLVIPCYNEAKNLPALIAEYRKCLVTQPSTEIILVNNGSQDDTEVVLAKELARAENSQFRAVKVEKNIGYGNGILAGLRIAQGRFLGWSHADHQCPPADVFRALEAMEKTGHPERCFAKGNRINDRGRAAGLTRIQARLASWILGYQMEEISAQPKIFPRSLFETFLNPPLGFGIEPYIYFKALRQKLQIVTIDVHFLDRRFGVSSWANSLWSKLTAMASALAYLCALRLKADRV